MGASRYIATSGFYGEHQGRRVHVKQGDLRAGSDPLVRRYRERFAAGDSEEQLAAARAGFPKSDATNGGDESLQPAADELAEGEDQGENSE